MKVLALLLDRGSDQNLANKVGFTAAHFACSAGGHVECIKLLIKRGANINMKTLDGFTPLDVARLCKHRECEDLLLSNDAVGVDVADIPVMDEADQVRVCMYVWLRTSGLGLMAPSRVFASLVLLYCLFYLILCRQTLSLPRNKLLTSTKKPRH